ncbi:MAG TPA: translation elongation factor 4 [Anaerolineae bacterium]|nr:translation elongation factor 4 [Anaerolineae bacterium]HNT05585.1 translation elongation factor 4 [Anaerolineae bacterium]HOU24884.1 translation elongation factor 4 [Anaerolineae bacterium]HQJ52030.1 translation elongation factor 4 [Anaerolineae bacterium]
MDPQYIRNFCIIAHIDHGKSTLSDRLLERTGTVSPREMSNQVLDQMDLEREKGITIKAKAVRMLYHARDGQDYELNLIDTPGHVDFTYEVSRALNACEGAILVVDASQGIEAQTLANLYMAIDHNLSIIAVVNKIDLPSAQPDLVAQDIDNLFGISRDEIIRASAKEGIGTDEILEAIIARIPPPKGSAERPLRALIFDSHYDSYKGVVAYVRVVDGRLRADQALHMMAKGTSLEAIEVGVFRPKMVPITELVAGDVGYVATGLKTVRECSVGDTITSVDAPAVEALPGYKPAKPMVFAGFYPVFNEDYTLLRDALEKLNLNDAALSFVPETSQALNFGFRCGFLGLLHMEIVQERLEREYGLEMIATAPSVGYQVRTRDGVMTEVRNPADLPEPDRIEEISEPWMRISVFTPTEFIGPVMELATGRRGEFSRMEYLDERRVLLNYVIPLSEIIVEFYDRLKASTRGYASLDYELAEYRPGNLVRLDVLVNGEPVDALSIIVHSEQAYLRGQALVSKLKRVIPRQLFDVAIQAAVGSRVISRANVKALRKDVLSKCYGGDVTRKRKLLEKQREGKRRLKRLGNVEIPQEAFMSILQLDE